MREKISRYREKISRYSAGDWIRTHAPLKNVVNKQTGEVFGNRVYLTQARLRRWLHDRRVPTGVRQHLYQFYRYRQRRGWAN